MAQPPSNVLIVEDDIDLLNMYSVKLADKEYEIIKARSVKEAEEVLGKGKVAVVATDLKLLSSDTGGFDILNMVRAQSSSTQVIIFTGVGGKDDAYEAMRRGAFDYLTKPLNYPRTIRAIKSAIGVYAEKVAYIAETYKTQRIVLYPETFIGSSQVMQEVFKQVDRVIDSIKPALIWGAPGTGKALIAETIHLTSKRKRFVLANCASYSETTLERTLFGFQKNAFPGATENEMGLLEQASGGTLVLDRINSLSPRLQRRLLTTLRQGGGQRIGSTQTFDIDIKVLATSQVNLRSHVQQGLFSEELYEYLSDSVIKLPPLKDRKDEQTDDVLLLTGYFLVKYGSRDGPTPTISVEASELLQAYDFPGNVRELEEAVRTAIIKARAGLIESWHLPEQIQNWQQSSPLAGILRTPVADNIICPHGYSLIGQAEAMAQVFDTKNAVYLSVDANAPSWYEPALRDVLARFGLRLYHPASLFDREGTCPICQPILASLLAILDISTLNPAVFYQLGLVHAAGVPCIILKRSGSSFPKDLGRMSYLEYNNAASLKETIAAWLDNLIASSVE